MPKLKFSNPRKSSKVLQMLSAFIFGIVISQLFTSSLLTFDKREIIDDKNYFLVILVLTSPTNFERRNAMRETWLSLRPREVIENYEIIVPINLTDSVEIQRKNLENFKKFLNVKNSKNLKLLNYKIKTFFAVGSLELDYKIKREIESENQVYHDLLVLDDLKDSYANLTLKLIKSIKKINEILPNFKYLLKVDDDTYVKLDYLAMDLINYEKSVGNLNFGRNFENYENLNNFKNSKNFENSKNYQNSENFKNSKNYQNSENEDFDKISHKIPHNLYWGYFNGRTNIKTSGPWQESSYNLCDHYLPYALGGGYLISKNLTKFIAQFSDQLSIYKSEDVSMGTWLSPFGKIHKRHDVRFDTAYMPRKCKNYHIVMHKRSAGEMRKIFDGSFKCENENLKTPIEYFYDWSQKAGKCCDVRV